MDLLTNLKVNKGKIKGTKKDAKKKLVISGLQVYL